MKGKIGVLFFSLFLLLLASSVSASDCSEDADCLSDAACDVFNQHCYTCVDSDGGEDYETLGNTQGVDDLGVYEDKTDSCSSSMQLLEYYCIVEPPGMRLNSEGIDCSLVGAGYGCVDGACVPDLNGDGVVDECSSSSDCIAGESCIDGACVLDLNDDEVVDECSSSSDCIAGETCSDGVCVAYCSYGETDCNDGVDNDGDGGIDYAGACYSDADSDGDLDSGEESSLVPCDAETVDGSGILRADACAECTNDVYTNYDADCVSPLDTSEASDGPTYAAEVEESFFARLWNWIIFWN